MNKKTIRNNDSEVEKKWHEITKVIDAVIPNEQKEQIYDLLTDYYDSVEYQGFRVGVQMSADHTNKSMREEAEAADTARNKLIEAIFDIWCEGYIGMKTEEGSERDCAIKNIANRFKTSEEDTLYIESEISAVVCAKEKISFMDGFYTCLELLNGNYFK